MIVRDEVEETKPKAAKKKAAKKKARKFSRAGSKPEPTPAEQTTQEETAATPAVAKPARKRKPKGEAPARRKLNAGQLMKEADKLAAASKRVREKAKAQIAKEALAASAQAVRELELYAKTLEKETAKNDAALAKAHERHKALTASK